MIDVVQDQNRWRRRQREIAEMQLTEAEQSKNLSRILRPGVLSNVMPRWDDPITADRFDVGQGFTSGGTVFGPTIERYIKHGIVTREEAERLRRKGVGPYGGVG